MARTRSAKMEDLPDQKEGHPNLKTDEVHADDSMVLDSSGQPSASNELANDHEDEDYDQENYSEEDENEGLARLSEQYRRYSESQQNQESSDAEEEDGDLMESVHGTQTHDALVHGNSDQEDEDLENSDEEEDHSHFRNPFGNPLAGHQGNSLAENVARLFPEAMGLFESLGGSPSNVISDIRGYITSLSRRDDSYFVLETLNELSSRLLMMNSLIAERGLPAYDLSHAIIGVLNEPMFYEELELQLVACRCLYNLIELNSDYVYPIVDAGGIEALRSKLLEISFIDLAEQALQALELISRFAGSRILRKNCLGSCLQFLDFFTIHAQRKAIDIAANSVKYIRQSEFHLIEDILPILQRIVLEYSDNQEIDKAWLAISRITKNFQASPKIESIASSDLVKKIISVIANSDTSLVVKLRLVNTLSTFAENKQLARNILQNGNLIDSIICALLKYKKSPDSAITIETLMAAPKDLLISILDLLIILLPIEEDSVLTQEVCTKRDYSGIYDHYKNFVNDVFPLLINIYQSTVVHDIRRRVIVCLVRIIHSLEDIKDLDKVSSITNLLAAIVIQNKSLMRSSDQAKFAPYVNLFGALNITHTLIERDPALFITKFEREGLLADTSSLLEILRADQRSLVENLPSSSTVDYEEPAHNNSHESDWESVESAEENEFEEEEEDEDAELDEEDYEGNDDEPAQSAPSKYGSSNPFKSLEISTMLEILIKDASAIEQIHLSKNGSESSKLEHLRLLDELAIDLSNEILISSYTYDDWLGIWQSFQNILSKDSHVISSFELVSCGIIEVLYKLLSDERYGSEGSNCRAAFLFIFKDGALEILVQKLQEALNRSELFEIIGCGLKSDENKVASLGKQLKVKLIAVDDDEDYFRGLKEFVILVHGISAFSNVSAFLKKRAETTFLFRDGNISAAENARSNQWHIDFILDGEVISPESTVYGAFYKSLKKKNSGFDTNKFWYETHVIKFRKAEGALELLELDDRYPESSEDDFQTEQNTESVSTLNLLKILHDLDGDTISFHNFKLTAKLKRQLEEPLIVASGILPTWAIHIARNYPFLFPLETRIFFLRSTSFGYSRLVELWNARVNQEENDNNNNGNNGNIPLGRPTRYKVRVSRKHLLPSAYKVLDKLGTSPGTLDIEFNEEVGTGLGPTLEFYSNVSHLFASKSLDIWRAHETPEDAEFVYSKNGLFPSPIRSDDQKENLKVEHFRYLGKFIARALLDNRIVDFSFNKVFFELAALEVDNQEYSLPKAAALEKLRYVDEDLFKSLNYLQKNKETVSDLALTFSLPGYDAIELKPNGSELIVNEENVDEYIEKVVDYTIGIGIKEQIQSFITGFSEVFPFYALMIFSPSELVQLLGKAEEDWSYETLLSSIRADHGYSIDSPTVQNLLTTMVQYDDQERRLFLQFLTGSPKLPIGGFKNLKPVFTVVLKHSEDGLTANDYLPSVMTCANYLKLPNYTTLEVLQKRLGQAVNEGAGAFLLS